MNHLEHISRDVDKGWRAFWLRRGFSTPPVVSSCTVGSFELPGQQFEFNGCIAPESGPMNKKTPTKKQILADLENIEESGIENQ